MLIFAAIAAIFVYDHVLSIEHEDILLAPEEGLSKAAHFLQNVVISDPPRWRGGFDAVPPYRWHLLWLIRWLHI
jgi:hypothetical protein